MIVGFQVVIWPLRSLRYFFVYHATGWSGYGPGGGGSVAWLAFLIVAVWLGNRHVPEVHQALENLPPVIHHCVDSLREWWSRR